MKRATSPKRLADWLRQVLAAGIRMDAQVAGQLVTTFGSDDLSTVLADPYGSETASFLELIFYPDRQLRERYERHWGPSHFSPRDEAVVIDALCTPPVETRLFAGRQRTPLRLAVPDFALAAFVRRLKIAWQPPAPLRPLWQRLSDTEGGEGIRAMLRHSRLSWRDVQVAATDRFLDAMPRDTADFEACFTFLLSILDQIEPDQSSFDFLIARKLFFFQGLCKAERFERLRRSSNMETLMLQGNRAAHGSIDQWREQMRRVDQICIAMFGRTRFFHPPAEEQLDAVAAADVFGMARIYKRSQIP